VLRARRGVDHHREVDVVEVAAAHQLGLAAEELEGAGLPLPHAPLEIAALLRGHGEEDDVPAQVLERACRAEAHRGAQQARHLCVVTAGMRGPGYWIGLRVPADDERVQLAKQREGRSRPLSTVCLGADASEGEAACRRETECPKRLLDER